MADDPVVPRRTKQARWMLKQSEKALRDVLDGFDEMRRMMLSGEQPSIPDLSKARVALGHARSQLLDEVNKYERHIFLSEGLTAEAPLDLEAIKDQIGSKLNCIRNAQDADGVSEQSED